MTGPLGTGVGEKIMAIHTSQVTIAHGVPVLPANYTEPHWYAANTSANHEKRVAEQLSVRNVEHFLPVYSSVRRWKDRRVTLQLPLFPGYVFVRMSLCNRLRLLQIPGVARLVGFGGEPTPLEDQEIDSLRQGLSNGLKATPHPYLTAGRRVRITAGPLAGREGVISRRKGLLRLILSLHLIQRSILVDVDAEAITPLSYEINGLARDVAIARQTETRDR